LRCWATEAGLPPGVFNIVTGDAPNRSGEVLTDRPARARSSPSPARLAVGKKLAATVRMGTVKKRVARARRQRALPRFSTTPIFDAAVGRRASSPNSATPARPASAPTASTCRTAIYDAFAAKLAGARRRAMLVVGDGLDGRDTSKAR
jgi:succinate-semialdehyde dehydrogenase/glutarate-semialdehyde dehydrogenase